MLILPIKKKWFDMIVSGEKTEEYREIKPYYDTRFRNCWGYPAYWGEKREVWFRNGYSSDSPLIMAMCTLSQRKGKPEWGAEPNKTYYVLTIHHILRAWGYYGEQLPIPNESEDN